MTSIYRRRGAIVLQYLLGGAAAMILLHRAGMPFRGTQVLMLLWFLATAWRFWTVTCPRCGKRPSSGPLPHEIFHPRCLNCGLPYRERVPAA